MRSTIHLLAVASLLIFALPASAAPDLGAMPCTGGACDTLNDLCGGCLPSDMSGQSAQPANPVGEARCMGPGCDAINAVCWIALKTWCVG